MTTGATGATGDRIAAARSRCDAAVFGGDFEGLAVADRELDAVEADVALARGRVIHARYLQHRTVEDEQELALFERAAGLFAGLVDGRGEGEALFWQGIVHQVIRHDDATAVPLFQRSLALAVQAADPLTQSYALRHLGIAAQLAGDLDAARAQLTESVRLRRELGFLAGVAANLVGLVYLAAAQGRPDEAQALAREAAALAEQTGAQAIAEQVAAARATLPPSE